MRQLRNGRCVEVSSTPSNTKKRGLREQREPLTASTAAVNDTSGEVAMLAGLFAAANDDSELLMNDTPGRVPMITGTSKAAIGDPSTTAEDIARALSRVTPTNEGPTSGPSTNPTADNTASSDPATDSLNSTVEDTADGPSLGHAQASLSNPTLEDVPNDPTGDAQTDAMISDEELEFEKSEYKVVPEFVRRLIGNDELVDEEEEFLRSELNATAATLGLLEFVRRRVEGYRRGLRRFRRQFEDRTGGESSGKGVELGRGLKKGRVEKAKRVEKGKGLGKRVHVTSN
ncbi:uncharacterized protein PAC_14775 [Phialocephala subalpina]|uniref:Uncharacterized protein n=1 Tax=Phialocephala subalpina TaxID=576137 RepID=A0A1L7XIK7_9HELO|nr:uncharacterized protein PAC_14775 [Phialocephala subalpina]